MPEGRLVSTRDEEGREISYTDALLEGLAPDGGLYTPTHYPRFSLEELRNLKNAHYSEVFFAVKKKLIGGTIPDDALRLMIDKAYSLNKFPHTVNGNVTPLKKIGDNFYLQNLSLGPTAAFKDMALQMLAQEMEYELGRRNKNLVILGATSGDTGSAAEAAFKGSERVKVFMLSPKTGMSQFQRAQMGELTGGNIFNISIDSNFDACQDLVKLLKKDPQFANLGAVNSINIGRIYSQIPYVFSGYLQAAERIGMPVNFTVPTGNFGDMLSVYIAKKMGLPINHMIVATNENDVMARAINTGVYKATPSQITSSPSMDISKASNFERPVYDFLNRDAWLVSKFMRQFEKTGEVDFLDFGLTPTYFKRNGFYAGTSTGKDRLHTIKNVRLFSGETIDTHTADAVKVAIDHHDFDVPMVVLRTALAVKFEDTINEALGYIPPRESRFDGLEGRVNQDSFAVMPPDANMLKSYIKANR